MLFVMAALLVGQRFSSGRWEKFCNNGQDLDNDDLAVAVEGWLEADTEQKQDGGNCPIATWDVSKINSTDALFMNKKRKYEWV